VLANPETSLHSTSRSNGSNEDPADRRGSITHPNNIRILGEQLSRAKPYVSTTFFPRSLFTLVHN